jgi:predicted ATPase
MKGELLLLLPCPDLQQVESCFQHALALARRQHAKMLELRAALRLGRLWQQQGKRVEARELLAPIYSWFTEGFATADLQEAKALLDELAAPRLQNAGKISILHEAMYKGPTIPICLSSRERVDTQATS